MDNFSLPGQQQLNGDGGGDEWCLILLQILE